MGRMVTVCGIAVVAVAVWAQPLIVRMGALLEHVASHMSAVL